MRKILLISHFQLDLDTATGVWVSSSRKQVVTVNCEPWLSGIRYTGGEHLTARKFHAQLSLYEHTRIMAAAAAAAAAAAGLPRITSMKHSLLTYCTVHVYAWSD